MANKPPKVEVVSRREADGHLTRDERSNIRTQLLALAQSWRRRAHTLRQSELRTASLASFIEDTITAAGNDTQASQLDACAVDLETLASQL